MLSEREPAGRIRGARRAARRSCCCTRSRSRAAIWAACRDALAAHHRVIAVDARGFGESPLGGAGYAIADLADDLAALLDALGVARATRRSGCRWAATRRSPSPPATRRGWRRWSSPTRAPPPTAPRRARRATAALDASRHAAPDAYLDGSLPRLLSPDAPPALRPPCARAAETRADQPGRRHRGAARSPRPHGRARRHPLPDAGRLRQRGSGDARRRDAAHGRARSPGATFVTIPGAGHLSHIEAPEAFERR